jgi:hypothetical protein
VKFVDFAPIQRSSFFIRQRYAMKQQQAFAAGKNGSQGGLAQGTDAATKLS